MELDPYWDTGRWACFPLFKRTADIQALCLSMLFRLFLRFGSFSGRWRHAAVTSIPKGPPSVVLQNTDLFPLHLHVLSNVFERFFKAFYSSRPGCKNDFLTVSLIISFTLKYLSFFKLKCLHALFEIN